jgi:hypothetical protein
MHPQPVAVIAATAMLLLSRAAIVLAVDTTPEPPTPAAALPAEPQEAAADKDPPAGGLADKVKDAVKDAVQGALAGTLKEKVSDTLKEVLTTPTDDGSKETKVVLRISKEFVRQHAPAPVESVSPVDKCLFGSRVTGTAVTKGRASLTMDSDHSKPVFTLHFKGTTVTRTVAVKHPVKTCSTGVAVFDVHRPIHFDGMQFSDGPESIEATYSSTIDGLTTPPGLRGRIVRKVAMPQIQSLKPKADAIALADTRSSVLAAFGRHSDELVSDLNARLPLKQTMAALMPQQTQWMGHFASTKDWILASPGPQDATIPQLPAEAERLQAPIELWVRGKPGDAPAAKVVAIWSAVHLGLGEFRRSPAPAATALKNITPDVVGDWWVLRVGADLVESMLDQLDDDEKKPGTTASARGRASAVIR